VSDQEYSELPTNWVTSNLHEVAEINPKLDKSEYADDLEVSFVPMSAVEAGTGRIDISDIREFGTVKKGYTAFREGDVLFAKITPCVENGKMAVVPAVKNALGFGSTEFHVLRPNCGISAEYIYYFVSSQRFRYDAEHNMTGAVGQRRVPMQYLANHQIALPPTDEQVRIVAKLEKLFSELEKGIKSLKAAREQISVYRQAVLKHAFEGKLTEYWREGNKCEFETAGQVLSRIRQERKSRCQQQIEDYKAAVKIWKANGKGEKRPTKPRAHQSLLNHKKSDASSLNKVSDEKIKQSVGDSTTEEYYDLPSSWVNSNIQELSVDILSGSGFPKRYQGKTEGDYQFAKVGDISRHYRSGKNNIQTADHYVSEQIREKIKAKIFPKNTIVFPKIGEALKSNYRVISSRSMLFDNNVMGIVPDSRLVIPQYLLYFLITQDFGKFSVATAVPSVRRSDIAFINVPLPPHNEQRCIISKIESLFSKANKTAESIKTAQEQLESLRQSILKKAFSGQLVEQDLNDEPVSFLLEQIEAEKADARKTKSSKNNSP